MYATIIKKAIENIKKMLIIFFKSYTCFYLELQLLYNAVWPVQ